ncbi:hypothetical protein BJY00DRAFT_251989 [Aspergillus carlsbadensis]|nr:hypothetical protein BJY00DRAFT_251989 [Aspergillus carlsbadensis]
MFEDNHNFAVGELAIFSTIHIVQFVVRFIQERRYWHHDRRRSFGWCFTYSWWGMVGTLSQLRVAGSAMLIYRPEPTKPILIAETVLQGIGLSFLLFEVSLVLLRSGQAGRTGPGNSRHPTHLRFTLHFFRFPAIISIIFVLVGRTIDIRACTIIGVVGIVAFVLTLALAWCVVLGLVAKSHRLLPIAGQRAVLVVLASLPFLTLRAVYFLLADYPSKYGGVGGNINFMGGVELMMEIIAVVLLIAARTVAEPLWAAFPETTLF